MSELRECVSYLRVSTGGQGRSGLGLEAQRAAVGRFTEAEGFAVVRELVEVETGKGHDALERRPMLAAALADARKRKCSIICAKLDRLGRDVHFISGLMVKRVPFYVANLGMGVDPFMLHIYAAIAEKEAKDIADRTRQALQAAKARGQVLGNPRLDDARAASGVVVRAEADRHAANVLPVIDSIRKAGVTTLQGIADSLNARGIGTPRGGTWHTSSVRNVLARAAA